MALADLAEKECVDFTVVGPEIPLVAGAVDEFKRAVSARSGPIAAAAALEGSKAFSRTIMKKIRYLTAAYETFGRIRWRKGLKIRS